jgi:hypothetical protein
LREAANVKSTFDFATPPDNNRFAAIFFLDPFERLVFVLSILEGQYDHRAGDKSLTVVGQLGDIPLHHAC